MRAHLDIIVVTMMLEEKLLVTPQGRSRFRTSHQPANQLFRAAKLFVQLRRAVVAKNSEHNSVFWHHLKLFMEVVLVLISPPIDIVGFCINHKWPMRMLLFVAKLIEFGQLHNRHGTDKVSNFIHVLANSLSGAIIVHLLQDIAPSIPKEIEGRLTVEGEHSEPIG